MNRGLIYSDYRANACFKYGDGVAVRGIGEKGFRANYGALTEPFTIPARGGCDGVAIVESAIDALSYRQLHPSRTVRAIAGNGNKLLMSQVLQLAVELDVAVFSSFDNDKGGDDGNDHLIKLALESGKNLIIQDRPPHDSKDWNDALLYQ